MYDIQTASVGLQLFGSALDSLDFVSGPRSERLPGRSKKWDGFSNKRFSILFPQSESLPCMKLIARLS